MNIARKLPDDWHYDVGYIGLLMLVGSSMYLRGRYDATSLPVAEWADLMSAQGPRWPLATGVLGWLLMAASLVTLLYTDWSPKNEDKNQ